MSHNRLHNMHGFVYRPAPGTRQMALFLCTFFACFALLGAVFLTVGGFWAHSDAQFFASALQTKGEIVRFSSDTDGHQHPVVAYSVDGEEYRQQLNYYSSSMRAGDAVTMYYAADAPHQARGKGVSGGAVFLLVGGIFFLIGAVGFLSATLPVMRKNSLRKNGECVSARVTAVTRLDNVRVNGAVPYRISCKTGVIPELAERTLKSPMIYRELPQSLVGTAVQVYAEPKRHKRYLVDADSLQIPVQSAEM